MPMYDNPGAPPVFDNIEIDVGRIMAGAHARGYIACDTRPGAATKSKTRLPRNKKFTRCPGCGGLVVAPCVLCSLESAHGPNDDD